MSNTTSNSGSNMNGSINVAGHQAKWKLCQHFNRETLYQELKKIGWHRHCPYVRSKASAIKEATEELVREMRLKHVMVRPLKDVNGDGYVAMLEEPGRSKNEYVALFSVRWEQPTESVEPYAKVTNMAGFASEVLANKWFQHCRKRIRSESVAKMIGVIITEQLDGVNQGGGWYWFHRDQIDQFNQLKNAVVKAAEGTAKLYCPQFDLNNEGAIELMRDVIREDVAKRADMIRDEAQREGVKERALRNRKKEAKALHDRVKMYEGFLGEALEDLHKAADACESAVVEAAVKTFPDVFGVGKKIEQLNASKAAADASQVSEQPKFVETPQEITAESINPFSF